jgi:hypothetical protein
MPMRVIDRNSDAERVAGAPYRSRGRDRRLMRLRFCALPTGLRCNPKTTVPINVDNRPG